MIGYNKSEIVGKMRERVILQNRIITQSDSGFQSEIYNDIGIYWSKIEYKTGFEEEDADKITNQQKINVTLRYNILVNVNSRFVYRNELYQVEKVEYSDDRRFMTCVCVWRSSYTSIYAGSISCSASLLAQSSLSAALMRVIKYQASLNAFGSVTADIALVQKVASSLNAFGTLTADINFVQKAQASLTGAGTTAADLTVTSSATLLLDLYPSAAAAYSLRKLRTAYTGSAVRVRRSSDNTEQDIGFTGNDLDTTALTTFVGAGNGFVTTWYDQSGNARNATQTTQANQPQIVSSGSVIITNSKPSLRFDGSNDNLRFAGSIFSGAGVRCIFSVYKPNNSTGAFIYSNFGQSVGTVAGSWSVFQTRTQFAGGDPYYAGYSADLGNGLTTVNTNQKLAIFDYNGTTGYLYRNQSLITSGNITLNSQANGNVYIGASFSTSLQEFANSNIQECIAWNNYQNTNVNEIRTNINTYYAIY